MSSSNTSLVDAVNYVKWQMIIFARCWGTVLFSFGLIGQILNIYVFTRRSLYSNSCGRYFLAATISGVFVVFANIPFRILQLGYSIDVFSTSIPSCQIMSYMFILFRILPSWFIALTCVDRFLCSSSSATLRGWSNTRVATRVIWTTVLFIILAFSHMFGFYTILYPQKSCGVNSSTYRAFYSAWTLLIWCFIPTSCVIIFGSLTIRNVRQGKRRIAPQSIQNPAQSNQRRTDRQLIQMMLAQSFAFGTTTLAYSIANLYISGLGTTPSQNAVETAILSNVNNMLSFITLLGPCMSFYLFTLSSELFRKELAELFQFLHRGQTPPQQIPTTHPRQTNRVNQ